MFSQLLRLSKHSIIYGFGVAISQFIGFFLLPLYTRFLTPADFGVLQIFITTQAFLGAIIGMGLGTALFMSFFKYDNEENRKKVVSTSLIFLTVASLCFTLILIQLASKFSLLLFASTQYTFYFQIIFLTLFFDVAIAIVLQVFRAREESKKFVLISLVRFLVSVGLNIYFVAVLEKGVLGILAAGLIVAGLLYLLLIPSIIKNTGLRFSVVDIKEMLSFGLPLVPTALGGLILFASDKYLLLLLSTAHQLGLYSLGYKFGAVILGLIVAPFTLAFGPFAFSEAKKENAKEVYSAVLTYFFLVAMFAALGLSVLSKEVLMIMTTPAFYDAYKVVPLIALSYVLYGCAHVFAIGIYLMKKTKYSPLITGICAIVNIGLNFVLIPNYAMMGAAVATVISFFILAVGGFIVSMKYYPIRYEWSRVAKIFLAAVLVYVGCLFITNDSAIIAGVLKLISLLGFPILLFVFGFFKPEEIQKAREIFRVAPEYIRLWLANNRLFWRS